MYFYIVWSYDPRTESIFTADLQAIYLSKDLAYIYAKEQEKIRGLRYCVQETTFTDAETYEPIVCIKKR